MAAIGAVGGFLGFMLQGIRTTAATLFLLPLRVQFLTIYLIGALFLLINANAIFEDPQRQQILLLIYLMMPAFIGAETGKPSPLLGITLAQFLVTFVLTLVGVGVMLKAFGLETTAPAVLTTASIGVAITHALIVAIGEESIFRHRIPEMLAGFPGGVVAAQGLSAILFGLFHWAAYQGDWWSVGTATIMGFVFGMIVARYPRMGLIAAMGAHAAWNLTVLGYF